MFKLIFSPLNQLASQEFFKVITLCGISPQFKKWVWNARFGCWEITKPPEIDTDLWEWLESCEIACRAQTLYNDVPGNFDIIPIREEES